MSREAWSAVAKAGGASCGLGAGSTKRHCVQTVDRRTLVRIAADANVVIQMMHRPGHFLVQDVRMRLSGRLRKPKSWPVGLAASAGRPAIMIRQPDALAKIMQSAELEAERAFLAEQPAMTDRLARSTVGEAADLADIQQAYRAVLEMRSGGHSIGAVTDRGHDASR